MSYKIKVGMMKLDKILDLAKVDYEDAEYDFRQFQKEYTESEIDEICEKLNIEGVLEDVF